MKHNKIIGLDGIRAIAVLLVIFSHHELWEAMGIDRAIHPNFAQLVNPQLGVKMFFVLSGFLITFLLLREHQTFGKVSLKKFYVRRFLRLMPLYYGVLILVVAMKLIGAAPIRWEAFPWLFTYTQNYMPNEYNYSATGHFWSLAVEEHFYLVWPFLFVLGRKIAFAFACVFIATGIWYGDGFNAHWTFPAAIGIAAGCLLAYAMHNEKIREVLSQTAISYGMLALSVLGLISPWWGYNQLYFIPGVMGLIAFVFLNQESLICKALEFKPIALIGVMSYGFYVWHAVLGGTGPYRTGATEFPVDMHVGTVLTFVVVPLSYYGFEIHFLKLKDKFRQSHAPATKPEQEAVAPAANS